MNTAPYVSLADFKTWAEIRVNTEDDRITAALAATTAAINAECDRDFHAVNETGADSERFYTPDLPLTLPVDDLIVVHELATDPAGNNSFDVVWEQDRDFFLEPLNALEKGRPFERVKVSEFARYLLVRRTRTVRITGVFGWPAVPAGVVQATLIVANRLRQRKGTPYGIASFGTETAMRMLRTDPDLQLLLNGLSRDTIIYG